MVVCRFRGLVRARGRGVQEAGGELPDELARRVLTSTATTAAVTTSSAEELAREIAEGVRTVAAAGARVLVATAKEGVHGHGPKTPIPRRPVHAPRAIRQDGLHGAVGVPHRLRPVRVGDELGLGLAVGVLDLLARRVARLGGLGGRLPLRHARRELDVVVLLAVAVPLRDPARGQRRRGERGTFGGG